MLGPHTAPLSISTTTGDSCRNAAVCPASSARHKNQQGMKTKPLSKFVKCEFGVYVLYPKMDGPEWKLSEQEGDHISFQSLYQVGYSRKWASFLSLAFKKSAFQQKSAVRFESGDRDRVTMRAVIRMQALAPRLRRCFFLNTGLRIRLWKTSFPGLLSPVVQCCMQLWLPSGFRDVLYGQPHHRDTAAYDRRAHRHCGLL